MFSYSTFKKILLARSSLLKKNLESSFIKYEVGKRLFDKLSFIKICPRNIYIEGLCEKSILNFKRKFSSSIIVDNIEDRPDLIISNCQLHLEKNIDIRLGHMKKYINKGGLIIFSIFGINTLQEIERAWSKVDNFRHVNQFIDIQTMGNLVLSKKFSDAVFDCEEINFKYDSLHKIITDLRHLNEPLADTKMNKYCTSKSNWNKFVSIFTEGGLSVTYNIIYGCAYNDCLDSPINHKSEDHKFSFNDLRNKILSYKKNQY